MNSLRIYEAGKMTGLSYDEMQDWRFSFKKQINKYVKAHDIAYCVNVFNPCDYYNTVTDKFKTKREVMEFDIYNLKKSDIVVVNLNSQNSIGTAMEIAIARDNGIPIIALCEHEDELHPWLRESCMRICEDMDELVEYVTDYFVFPLLV